MVGQSSIHEKSLLKISVYGALFFAFLAIIWGVFENSKIILFDGVYSLISVGLSIISLITASYMKKQDQIREEILNQMSSIPLKKWLNVAFTNDRKWAV
jgi:predicted Co/Zn/Cd cation transporter (cation efflux family)